MIREVKVQDPTKTCVPWWGDVPFLRDHPTIQFKPGLNVLWGPNGSGKSSVLRIISQMLHCDQGGVQLVTQTSLGELRSRGIGQALLDGATIDHDGSPVAMFDPGKTVGLFGGSFDYDFTDQGILNATFKGSAGQLNMTRGADVLKMLMQGTPVPKVSWKAYRPDFQKKLNPRDEAYSREKDQRSFITWVDETLAGDGTRQGPATILLDEPERSFDVVLQQRIWERLPMAAAKVQVIVATHSPLALRAPFANFIEFREGYLAQAEKALSESWLMMSLAREAKNESRRDAGTDGGAGKG